MKTIEDPAYVLAYREHPTSGTLHCANLATLIRAKRGHEKELDVYVRPEDDRMGELIKAKATTTPDRKWVNVVVTIGDGLQKFIADASKVMSDMSKEHPKKKSW